MIQGSYDESVLLNRASFGQAKAELGENFVRILGYFREDGEKSVRQIEAAVRKQDATALVIPAHTLKGESRQFGAEPLADLAETIEMIARTCVERHDAPGEAIEHVVELRPVFEATLSVLEREAQPVASAPRRVFGRRQGRC